MTYAFYDHRTHTALCVTLTFYSEEGLMDMRIKGSENCRRALLGQPVRNLVNGAM